MKRLLPFALLALAGCGTAPPPAIVGDATVCATALLASGAAASPAALLPVALATPACSALAMETIHAVVAQVAARKAMRQ